MKVFRAGLTGLVLTILVLILLIITRGHNTYINILMFSLNIVIGACLGYVLDDWLKERKKYRNTE